jgi:hypothetical protein
VKEATERSVKSKRQDWPRFTTTNHHVEVREADVYIIAAQEVLTVV